MSLVFNDVVRFMQQEQIVLTCPCCYSDEWTIFTESSGEGLGIPYALSSSKVTPSGDVLGMGRGVFPVVVMECDLCGFIRPHSYKKIQQWVENNPAPPVNPNIEPQE